MRKISRVEPGYSRRALRTFSSESAVLPTASPVRRRPGGGTSLRDGRTSALGLTGLPGSPVARPPALELPGARICCAPAGAAAASATSSSATAHTALRTPTSCIYARKLQSLLPMKFIGVAAMIAIACAGTSATPRPSTSV